jgi:hypothetical protein
MIRAIPPQLGGAFRERHGTSGRDAVDAEARETGAAKRTVKSCGSDSLRVGVKFAGSYFPRATVTNQIRIAGKSTKQPYKHCAGMPGVSGVTVAHVTQILAAGASAPGIPAPSDRRAKEKFQQSSGG